MKIICFRLPIPTEMCADLNLISYFFRKRKVTTNTLTAVTMQVHEVSLTELEIEIQQMSRASLWRRETGEGSS